MYYLAFDAGGTATKFGIIDEDYNIIEKGEYPTNARLGKDSIINNMLKVYHNLKNKYELSGIAISSPGIIDYLNGVVEFANFLMPEIMGINYSKELGSVFDLPVSVENDVNCFALSQSINLKSSFLMITVGTGIGGAIIVDGRVLHGASNSAGEFGQMLVKGDKWEEVAAMSTTVKKAQTAGLPIKNGIELFNLYDNKNLDATKHVNEFYNNLALGIANLAYIFNPEVIYIGGGITNRKEFINELKVAVTAVADPMYFKETKLKLAKGLNDGGLIGAVIHHRTLFNK